MTEKGGVRPKRDTICTTVARLTGYSYEYVRLVRNGERDNETVLDAIMAIVEGTTKLHQEVARITPIGHKNSSKRGQITTKKRVSN